MLGEKQELEPRKQLSQSRVKRTIKFGVFPSKMNNLTDEL